jgi:xylan 1,4-beta-xylosidase
MGQKVHAHLHPQHCSEERRAGTKPARALRAVLAALAMAMTMAIAAAASAIAQDASFPVTLSVDAARHQGAVKRVWRFFGADEPNYATMKDGRTTLATLGSLAPDSIYFRTHNLLTSGDGTPAL